MIVWLIFNLIFVATYLILAFVGLVVADSVLYKLVGLQLALILVLLLFGIYDFADTFTVLLFILLVFLSLKNLIYENITKK